MSEEKIVLLFSDLDGTLLDETSYSFESARPALDLVRSLPVFLVLCTSKTRAELLPIQEELGLRHPFIVENGGAVFFPESLFGISPSPQEDSISWIRVELGIPYRKLVDFLSRIRREEGISITGFNDLSVAEIAELCGFSLQQAQKAKMREYDEPFLLPPSEEDTIDRITAAANRKGMKITRGGRFFHLTGDNDKGQAVKTTIRMFRRRFSTIFTIGIGDSINDLPMLEAVEVPIVVQRPDRQYQTDLLNKLPHARRAPGIGPTGWNFAISEILMPMIAKQTNSPFSVIPVNG